MPVRGVRVLVVRDSLGSRGQGCATHPAMGGAVRPSHRSELGRCSDILASTALWCCLARALSHGDGVSPVMAIPSVLAERVGRAILVRAGVLMASDLPISFFQSEGRGEVEHIVWRSTKGEVVVDHLS